MEKNRRVTLPLEFQRCEETGRIDAIRQTWKPGQPNKPHIFWDSDVAKLLEACCYSLGHGAMPGLRLRWTRSSHCSPPRSRQMDT